MRARFLISAPAFLRLGSAASDRGWCSDPEYARITVERVIARSPAAVGAHEIGGRRLEDLAAMSGEFPVDNLEAVTAAIARFFGERPPCVEACGLGHGIAATLGAGGAPAA